MIIIFKIILVDGLSCQKRYKRQISESNKFTKDEGREKADQP